MKPEIERPQIVLLVDDNPTNLGVLFNSLSDLGFKILVAQDGESAIAQVNYLRPDIILLDVMMPGIDGFETCRRLKASGDTHDIPVIFMTALSETVDKVKGFEAGAVDYITKPFQPEEVLARINAHLAIQQLQRQLQQQNQRLQQEICDREQAEQALKVVLHAVSHDLRNPVTGMLMVLTNLLKSGCCPMSPNPPSVNVDATTVTVPRTILERMTESGDRQLSLINSLLEAHTLETQGIALHREPVQLQDLFQRVIQEMQPLLLKNRATLTNHITMSLPLVNADPAQLWRVIENLLSNALKHNPPGLSLVVNAEVRDDHVRCIVEDDGVGISSEQADKLFELYRRGANARNTHGLGLGLYLCRQIIRAHRGDIGVYSAPDKGACFWFTLPLWYPPTD